MAFRHQDFVERPHAHHRRKNDAFNPAREDGGGGQVFLPRQHGDGGHRMGGEWSGGGRGGRGHRGGGGGWGRAGGGGGGGGRDFRPRGMGRGHFTPSRHNHSHDNYGRHHHQDDDPRHQHPAQEHHQQQPVWGDEGRWGGRNQDEVGHHPWRGPRGRDQVQPEEDQNPYRAAIARSEPPPPPPPRDMNEKDYTDFVKQALKQRSGKGDESTPTSQASASSSATSPPPAKRSRPSPIPPDQDDRDNQDDAGRRWLGPRRNRTRDNSPPPLLPTPPQRASDTHQVPIVISDEDDDHGSNLQESGRGQCTPSRPFVERDLEEEIEVVSERPPPHRSQGGRFEVVSAGVASTPPSNSPSQSFTSSPGGGLLPPPPPLPPPPSLPPSPIQGMAPSRVTAATPVFCRLCDNGKPFNSDHDFDVHLTFIHYRDKIMRRIKWPFECLKCKFTPAEGMDSASRADELLMHYGCDEKVSFNYYQQECSTLPSAGSSSEPLGANAATIASSSSASSPSVTVPEKIICKLCSSSHDNERLFVRHLSLRHYADNLKADLPKEPPFVCPFIDCCQEKVSLHSLMLHYGCEHPVCMELYQKEKEAESEEEAIETVELDGSPTLEEAKDRRSSDEPEVVGIESVAAKQPSVSKTPVARGEKQAPKETPERNKSSGKEETNSGFRPNVETSKPASKEMPPEEAEHSTEKDKHSSPSKEANKVSLKSKVDPRRKETGGIEKLPEKAKNGDVSQKKSSEVKGANSVKGGAGKLVELDIFSPTRESAKSKSQKDQEIKSSRESHQTLSCPKCHGQRKISFVTQRSLTQHLVQTHYLPDLSKNPGPYSCLMCSESFKEKGLFVHHFIAAHLEKYAELFKQGKEPRKRGFNKSLKNRRHSKDGEQGSKVKEAKAESSETSKSEKSSSAKIARKESAKEDASALSRPMASPTSEAPIPQNRVRQTVHVVGELTARQRMLKKWEHTSIDGSKHKIKELEAQLKEMEESHKNNLKQKAKEFERWIDQKEKALEDEVNARKEVEEKLEQAQVDSVDFEKKLEQANAKYQELEESMEDVKSEVDQLAKEKKALEKSLAATKQEMVDHEESVAKAFEGEKKAVKDKEAVEDSFRDLQVTLSEKDDEIKEMTSTHKFEIGESEKKMKRLEKQVEHHKTKAEKLQEEKKERNNQVKELNKKHKEEEADLKEQIQKLTKENRALTTKSAQEKRQELKKLEKDQSRVGELEEQISQAEKKADQLASERECLLDSLDQLQKILKDFDVILKEKNDKIQEMGAKQEDLENNLEDALQQLSDQKGVDKEKKELGRQIKQLQSTLQDWEARQFSNVKLIAGLEKENSDLKKKVKDFEENNTGAEEELYDLNAKVKSLEKKIASTTKSFEVAEQERAKALARLSSKNEEVDTLKSRNLTLGSKVQTMEKALRQTDLASTFGAGTSGGVGVGIAESLNTQLMNREGELKHLKTSLLDMQNRCNVERAGRDLLAKELAKSKLQEAKTKKRNAKLEANFRATKEFAKKLHSKMVADHDTFKKSQESNSPSSLKPEPAENDSELSPPPPPIPELADDFEQEEEGGGNVINADSGRHIVLNVAAMATAGDGGDAEGDGTEEEIDVDGGGGVSPPRSSYRPRTITDSDLRAFFPEEDNLPPLSFDPPGSKSSTKRQKSKSGGSSRRLGKPVDVTGVIDEDADNTLCGICNAYDPPELEDGAAGGSVNVGWVGCDCDRWFHKQCTKMTRFTDRFSCRSVKMRCNKGAKAKNSKKATSSSNVSSAGPSSAAAVAALAAAASASPGEDVTLFTSAATADGGDDEGRLDSGEDEDGDPLCMA